MTYCTEKEAKGKWCPFTRVWVCDVEGNFDNVAINRMGDTEKSLHPNANCIASACMAWRTLNQTHANNEPPPVPRGYCGLAGNPHPAYIVEKR